LQIPVQAEGYARGARPVREVTKVTAKDAAAKGAAEPEPKDVNGKPARAKQETNARELVAAPAEDKPSKPPEKQPESCEDAPRVRSVGDVTRRTYGAFEQATARRAAERAPLDTARSGGEDGPDARSPSASEPARGTAQPTEAQAAVAPEELALPEPVLEAARRASTLVRSRKRGEPEHDAVVHQAMMVRTALHEATTQGIQSAFRRIEQPEVKQTSGWRQLVGVAASAAIGGIGGVLARTLVSRLGPKAGPEQEGVLDAIKGAVAAGFRPVAGPAASSDDIALAFKETVGQRQVDAMVRVASTWHAWRPR
jgi:hypothetical protein